MWGAIIRKLDLQTTLMKDVFAHFGLEPGTQDFIGHALALNLDDGYKERAAWETYEKILLYNSSLARYGRSPYIYPMYGLGDLPQAFARWVDLDF
jgi:Rab GDP dissociation inhibitor